MSNIRIVTDSAVALTPEEIQKYEITVVPLTVQIDGVVYEDGVTLQREAFLEQMAVSQNLPQTSQPSIGKFQAAYEDIRIHYPDAEILSIHLSSGLSGTVHAAEQAAALTSAEITTFDTLNADRSQAFQVLVAAKMAQLDLLNQIIQESLSFQASMMFTDYYLFSLFYAYHQKLSKIS